MVIGHMRFWRFVVSTKRSQVMSDKPDNDESYYHNKGQEDASEGDYDPPGGNSIVHDFGNMLFGTSDKEIEDRKEYDKGWRHTKDQKD
jgi:hypothetical protein